MPTMTFDVAAVGDGVTNDTTAFQAAINAAKAAGGGIVRFGSAAGYHVNALDLTGAGSDGVMGGGPEIILQGPGLGGPLLADTTHHLLDLSGANQCSVRDVAVLPYGTIVPQTIVFWGSVAGQVQQGLRLDNLTINARASAALVATFGGVGLLVVNPQWFQQYNGTLATDPSFNTSCLRLDNTNELNLASDFRTLLPSNVTTGATILGGQMVDNTALGGTRSGNEIIVMNNVGQFAANGTIFKGNGPSLVVVWHFSEGLTFRDCGFLGAPGANQTSLSFFDIGGPSGASVNGGLILDRPFFTNLSSGGAYVYLRPAVGGTGGITHLVIRDPDYGGNTNLCPLLTPLASSPALNPCIDQSDIDCDGFPITVYGSIINTILREPPANISYVGTTGTLVDHSLKLTPNGITVNGRNL